MNPNNIPQHVAIIMDGNGRWAKRQGRPRIQGHQIGAERVEDIIKACTEAGVKYLTLYAFSKENWQRPAEEVSFLMKLLAHFLELKLTELKKNNVVFNTIGCVGDLPEEVQKLIEKNREATRDNTGLVTTFAFSYSSRHEITEVCRTLAREARDGVMKPEDITEATVASRLDTRDLPDPDLLIRTSGELRISNFLLWQISYSEIYITDKLWPEFTREEFVKAIEAYQKRERRFGRTEPAAKQG